MLRHPVGRHLLLFWRRPTPRPGPNPLQPPPGPKYCLGGQSCDGVPNPGQHNLLEAKKHPQHTGLIKKLGTKDGATCAVGLAQHTLEGLAKILLDAVLAFTLLQIVTNPDIHNTNDPQKERQQVLQMRQNFLNVFAGKAVPPECFNVLRRP
jgi:hypothetical protein